VIAQTLVGARFLRRYQRFFADVRLADGNVVQAHVPNTGSMRSLVDAETQAWLRPASDPTRKLRWTVVLLATPKGGLAVVDTGLPNAVVAAGVTAGLVPELSGYASLRREVPYGRASRIDLYLEHPERPPCLVEIKNVTMASVGNVERADFPDAVTTRGRTHLHELALQARAGRRCVQFFLVDRSDCTTCGIASAIDPAYAEALLQAMAAGVEVLAYRADISPHGVSVGTRCPFVIP